MSEHFKNGRNPRNRRGELGNVFFTLFGAVAIVGVLGAGIMATMRGPLTTMVEVNRREQAKSELQVAASLVLSVSNDEDNEITCEGGATGDGYTEGPLPVTPGGPTGGGLLPSIGATLTDPWGNAYGYCVWDHGPDAPNSDGACAAEMLAGTVSTNKEAIAVMSAGPNGVFDTTCGADPTYVSPIGGGGDDIVVSKTYDQAISGSGGLWNIKASDPNVAEITKNLEVTGGAQFTDVLSLSGPSAQLRLGASSLLLPDETLTPNSECSSAADVGMLRYNTSGAVEVCDGTNFVNSGSYFGTNANGIDYSGGNVGIGVALPNDALDVAGSAQITGSTALDGAVTAGSTLGVTGATTLTGSFTANSTSNLNDSVVITSTATDSTPVLTINQSGPSEILRVQSDGNVGIGDNSPNDALDVSGAIDLTEALKIDGINTVYNGPGTDTILLGQDAGASVTGNNNTVVGAGAAGTLDGGSGNIVIGQGADVFGAAVNDNLVIGSLLQGDLANSRLGIGFAAGTDVSTFNDTLEVDGSGDFSGTLNVTDTSTFGNNMTITGDTNDGTTDPLTIEDSSSSVIFTVNSNGRVDASDFYIDGTKDLDPGGTCGAGNFSRWDGNSWQCDPDGTGGGDGVGADGLPDVLDNDPSANNLAITDLADPTDAQDAATKNYVDNQIGAASTDRIEDFDGNTYIDVDADGTGGVNSTVFVNSGTQRMSINAAGTLNIGVPGTAPPTTVMQVNMGYGGGVADFGITSVDGRSFDMEFGEEATSFLIRYDGQISATDDRLHIRTPASHVMTFSETNANVKIGATGASGNASSLLELDSTAAGFLAPRMTLAQRDAIGTPATGLLVFSTDAGDSGLFQFYDGGSWVDVGAGGTTGAGLWREDGTNDYIEYDDTLGGVRIGRVTGQPAPVTDWELDVGNSVIYTTANTLAVGSGVVSGTLQVDVTGDIGATQYCDQDGNNCFTAATVSGGGGGLWTDDGTYISYDNAHFLNAGAALDAALDDNGKRFFFYENKAALRGGEIVGADPAWQDANIGGNSIAWGLNARAVGYGSTAFGDYPRATGQRTVALGYHPLASGDYSTSIGRTVTSSGYGSTALGFETRAGDGTASDGSAPGTGLGDYSVAIGAGNASGAVPQVTGDSSVGIFMGDQTGVDVTASNTMSVIGGGLVVGSPTLDDEGSGTYDQRMLFDPATGAFRAGLTSGGEWNSGNRGTGSIGLGRNALASNTGSITIGSFSSSTGQDALAFGFDVIASGQRSMAFSAGNSFGGTNPTVSAVDSFGFFMDNQADVNLATSRTVLIAGGSVIIDPAAPASQVVPRTSLDVGAATDAFFMPVGTVGQRPGSPLDGMIRFNSDDDAYEVYSTTAGDWIQIVANGSIAGGVAGNDTEVQFNDSGAPGADADFTYDQATNTLSVGSVINVGEKINIAGVAGNAPSFANLDDLDDVSVAGPTDGFLLSYNSGAGSWVAIDPSTLVSSIPDRIQDTGDGNTYIDVDTDDADSNNTVSIATAGTERLLIDSNGNLGLGTADVNLSGAPTDYRFRTAVDGNKTAAAESYAAFFGTAEANNPIGLSVSVVGAAAATDRKVKLSAIESGITNVDMILQESGGDIGIGTTTPNLSAASTALTLSNTNADSTTAVELQGFRSGSDGDVAGIGFYNGTDLLAGIRVRRLGADNSGSLIFSTTNLGTEAEAMRITRTGYVGIGTNNPSEKLTVVENYAGGTNIGVANLDADATAASNVIAVTDAGLVGIGLSSTAGGGLAYLATDVAGGLSVQSEHATTSRVVIQTGAGPSPRMIVDHDGLIGMNTLTPQTLLDANGTLKIADGGEACDANREGGIRYDGTGDTFYFCALAANGWEAISLGSGVTEITDLSDAYTDYATNNNLFIAQGAGSTIVGDPVTNSGNTNTLVGINAGSGLSTGSGNIMMGFGTASSATTAAGNIFIGNYSGQRVTSAYNNVTLGHGAGRNLDDSNNNVFIGLNAGRGSADTDYSISGTIAIGSTAGAAIETGADNNVFIGRASGAANTTGQNNVYVGRSTGTASTTANNNVYIGDLAGTSNTSSQNTVLGFQAGMNMTGGTSNTYLGYQAGIQNLTGDSNIMIGLGANAPTTATNDWLNIGDAIEADMAAREVFIDAPAAEPLDTDFDNGSWSLWLDEVNDEFELKGVKSDGSVITQTVGSSSSVIYLDDLGDVTTDYTVDFNMSLGQGAGASLLGSAQNNVFLGQNAGNSVDSGSSNTFLGRSAGASTTSGPSNVAIGHTAGRYNETGGNNVFIGRNAAQGTAAGSSDVNDSVIIGFSSAIGVQSGANLNTIVGTSGASALTDGTSNTLLGANAGDTLTTGDRNIMIGIGADVSGATVSDELNIGNTIYGDLANTTVTVPGHAALGANSTVNTNYFGATAHQSILNVAESIASADPTRGIAVQLEVAPTAATDNVGVNIDARTGTASAQNINSLIGNYAIARHEGTGTVSLLEGVRGNALVSNGAGTVASAVAVNGAVGNFGSTNITAAHGVRASVGNLGSGTITDAYGVLVAPATNAGTITNNYGLYVSDQTGLGTNNFNIYSDGTGVNYFEGNVGIGTTDPTNKLTVLDGNIAVREDDDGDNAVQIGAGTDIGWILLSNAGTQNTYINSALGAPSYFNAGGYVFGNTTIDASAYLQIDSTTQGFLPPRMTTTERDNIALPATGLTVYNTTTNTTDYFNGTIWVSFSTSAGTDNDWQVDIPNSYVYNTTDNIGIGTATPQSNLHLGAAASTLRISSDGDNTAIIIDDMDTANRTSFIDFQTGAGVTRARIAAHTGDSGTDDELVLNTGNTIGQMMDMTSDNQDGTAFGLYYNVDKGTGTGDDWGLLINKTTTASPGTSRLIEGITDSTSQFWVDDAGNGYLRNELGIGTTTTSGVLHAVSDNRDMFLDSINGTNASFGPDFQLRRSRAGAIVQENDKLGGVRFYGHDGNDFRAAGTILVESDGTPGASDMPGRMVFNVTADGELIGDGTAEMVIKNTGNVGIGTLSPTSELHVVGTNNTDITIENNDPSAALGARLTLDNTIQTGGRAFDIWSTGSGNGPGAGSLEIFDVTAGATRIAIDPSGRIGMGTNNPEDSALLDLTSTTLGFLPPRMTTGQRDLVAAPVAGLTIYNTTDGLYQFFNGTIWADVGSNAVGAIAINDLTDAVTTTGSSNNLFLVTTPSSLGATDTDNIGLGLNALTNLNDSGAQSNIAIGGTALSDVSGGDGNIALGYFASPKVTTGGNNITMGSFTANEITSGNSNISIGDGSGSSNDTGSDNIFIGEDAGIGSVIGVMNRNIAIGTRAGSTIEGGAGGADNNLLLGYQAGDVITTGDNNIIIGYDVDPSSATASSELNIGDLIYGDLANNQVMIGDTRVIQALPNSNQMFQSYFDATATNIGDFAIGTSSNAATRKSDIDLFRSRGGVGSETAVANDDELGSIRFTGYDGNSYETRAQITGHVDGAVSDGTVPTAITFRTETNTNVGTSAERMRISSTGNVGIGTPTPDTLLHLHDQGNNPQFRLSGPGNSIGEIIFEENDQGNNFIIRYSGADNNLSFIGAQSGTTMSLGRERASVAIGGTTDTLDADDTNIPDGTLTIEDGALCTDDGGTNCNDVSREAGSIYALGTGSILMPAGTTAQRPTGIDGMIRFNSTTDSYEVYSTTAGDWVAIVSAGAAVGGGSAGADTQVIYNDSGTLTGEAAFTYDQSNDTMTIATVSATDRISLTPKTSVGTPNGLAINDLDDVNTSGVTDGQLLAYNNTSGDWEPVSAGSGGLWTDNTTYISRTGDILVDGTYTGTSSVPVSGAGVRMFFDVETAAFRVGSVNSNQWDDSNVSSYSIAMGQNPRADAANAVAIGPNSIAGGSSSVAIGQNAVAQRSGSFALGTSVTTDGDSAMVIGRTSEASGYASIALGQQVLVGDGTYNSGAGDGSMAIGLLDDAVGNITDPQVTGIQSLGIFMGPQAGYNLSVDNRMALVGGDFLIDDDGTAGSQGCIRYVEGTGLQFSNDCSSYTDFGTATVGGTDTQVHFNNAGVEDGDAGLTYLAASNTLNIGSTVNVGDLVSIGSTTGAAAPTGTTGTVSLNLGDLGDVSTTAPTDTQVLTYNASTGEWEPQAAGGGGLWSAAASGNGSDIRYNPAGDDDDVLIGVDSVTAFMDNNGQADLEVEGLVKATAFNPADGNPITWGDGTTTILADASSDYIALNTDSATQLLVNATGVGIFTTTPSAELDVNGDIEADSLILNGVAGNAPTYVTPSIALSEVSDVDLTGFSDGDVLTYNNTSGNWEPQAAGGAGSSAINDLSDAYTDYTTDFNLYMGDSAGSASSPGQYNVGLGQNALTSLDGTCSTAGQCDANTAIGYNALTANTLGGANTALGTSALATNTSGASNTAIGYAALAANDTGLNNTAVGQQALGSLSGVQINNSAFGLSAGVSLTTGTANTFLGSSAGASLGTGSNNTFVGQGAALLQTAGSNNIAIGYNVALSDTTGSNQLNIGDILTGDLSTSVVRVENDSGFPQFQLTSNNTTLPGFTNSSSIGAVANSNVFGRLTNNLGTDGLVTTGGMLVQGFTNSAENAGYPLDLQGTHGGTSPTTPAVRISGQKYDGSDNRTALANNEIIMDVVNNYYSTTPLMRIMGDGNVGIGVTTPAYMLHVEDGDIALGDTTDAARKIFLQRNGTMLGKLSTDDSDLTLAAMNGNDIRITPDGGITDGGLFIADSGDIAIKHTNPQALLDLGNNTIGSPKFLFHSNGNVKAGMGVDMTGATWEANFFGQGNGTNGHLSFGFIQDSDGTTYNEEMRLTETGFLGINNTAPNVALDVTGDIEYTGTITDVSDARLKDNIEPLTKYGSLLDRIDQIETVSFVMKDDEDKRKEFGVIAQQLETVFPELVHTAEDEMGTKSVNYVGLIAPMIEATKELKDENAALKTELEEMRSERKDVKDAVESLNKQVELLNKAAANKVEKASILPENWMLLLIGFLGGLCMVLVVTRKKNQAG